jgi:hypothetical protein
VRTNVTGRNVACCWPRSTSGLIFMSALMFRVGGSDCPPDQIWMISSVPSVSLEPAIPMLALIFCITRILPRQRLFLRATWAGGPSFAEKPSRRVSSIQELEMAETTKVPAPSLKDQIAQYSVELLRLREMLDVAFAKDAKATSAPEDAVIFPLLVSCRDILEEILFAIRDGLGRAAIRSARTMYECVVIARHLALHPEKAGAFLNTLWKQWAKVIQNIPLAQRSPEMHAQLCLHLPQYAQGKMIKMKDLDWSGKHTRKMAEEAGPLAELHSLAFDWASAYIHPSAIFVLSLMQLANNKIQLSEGSQDEEGREALRIAHDLILNAVDLRLKYRPSDTLKALLDQCESDFANIWGYAPHI